MSSLPASPWTGRPPSCHYLTLCWSSVHTYMFSINSLTSKEQYDNQHVSVILQMYTTVPFLTVASWFPNHVLHLKEGLLRSPAIYSACWITLHLYM